MLPRNELFVTEANVRMLGVYWISNSYAARLVTLSTRMSTTTFVPAETFCAGGSTRTTVAGVGVGVGC